MGEVNGNLEHARHGNGKDNVVEKELGGLPPRRASLLAHLLALTALVGGL